MIQGEKRIEWVDIAKGFGIICVVVGHIFPLEMLENIIYLFHMPLFFFLSGFLYKKANILPCTKKKAQHLLIPYVSFFIVLALFAALFTSDEKQSVQRYLVGFISGRPGTLFYDIAPLWFLPSLFLTQVIYNIFWNTLTKRNVHIVCFIIYMLSVLMNIYECENITFWSFSILSITIPFFHLGYLYRQFDSEKYNIVFILIGAFAILSPLLSEKNTMVLYTGYTGIPLLTVIMSVFSIIFIIKISHFVERFSLMSDILSRLGKSSLTIMALHLSLWLALMKVLRTDYPLYKPTALLYIVMTIAISYIIHFLLDKNKITRLLFLGIYKSNKTIEQ